jgi:hypothetical protein
LAYPFSILPPPLHSNLSTSPNKSNLPYHHAPSLQIPPTPFPPLHSLPRFPRSNLLHLLSSQISKLHSYVYLLASYKTEFIRLTDSTSLNEYVPLRLPSLFISLILLPLQLIIKHLTLHLF